MQWSADKFILERVSFFEKDMKICLKGIRIKPSNKITHAYFPALMLCFANLEFMGRLYGGEYVKRGKAQVKDFVDEFMDTTTYSTENIDVLWDGFRHKLAHLTHPEYVYKYKQKRITWAVSEKKTIVHKCQKYPHMQIRQKKGYIGEKIFKPYPVQYTHIIYISLPVFKSDIQKAMKDYSNKIKKDEKLQTKFDKIIKKIFPK